MAFMTRFRRTWINRRRNPFTQMDLPTQKEELAMIPVTSPYFIQLTELPKKDSPSTVQIVFTSNQQSLTEVSSSPAQGQFRVDYPEPDGEGTGLIEFNANDAGKEVQITYYGLGSPVVTEFLDTLMPLPANCQDGDMFYFENDDVKRLPGAVNPATKKIQPSVLPAISSRYFHEGELYSSTGENEHPFIFRFKKPSLSSKVVIDLKGYKGKAGFYEILPSHYHGISLSPSIPQHTHGAGSLVGSQPAHTHGAGTLSGSQPAHDHTGATAEGGKDAYSGNPHTHSIYADGDDPVTISGNTAAGGNDAVTISGNTDYNSPAYININGNSQSALVLPSILYPKNLKIYIDGVDRTSSILALAGMQQFGDGTANHVFVTNGTGEIDISNLVSGLGIHEIIITEPEQGILCRVAVHLEVTEQ